MSSVSKIVGIFGKDSSVTTPLEEIFVIQFCAVTSSYSNGYGKEWPESIGYAPGVPDGLFYDRQVHAETLAGIMFLCKVFLARFCANRKPFFIHVIFIPNPDKLEFFKGP